MRYSVLKTHRLLTNFLKEIIFHPNIKWGEVIHSMCGVHVIVNQPIWDIFNTYIYSVGLFDHLKVRGSFRMKYLVCTVPKTHISGQK